jgi:hypothetical protein
MKIFLQDQSHLFDQHLNALMSQPVMAYNRLLLRKKVSSIDLHNDGTLNDINLDFFFDYFIFPPHITCFRSQWSIEKRKMKVGDTILQQVFIPPFQFISQKIIFGVRINSIIEKELRKGFSYETLAGHLERGESTFAIEQTDKGLIFKIQTFSEPGNFLSKLAGPIFPFLIRPIAPGKHLKM